MRLRDFVSMIRPLNCIMAAVGAFIGYCIASGLIQFQFGIAVAMAVAFFVCAGGMVINDYFDRAVDRKLHPGKPIASGRVSESAAMAYSCALFFVGNLLGFCFLPRAAFVIAFAFTVLLMAYSRFLSRAKFLGNWVVAAGTAFTLVFGASLVGNYSVVAWFAVSALFANLARELIKDSEDLRADRGCKKSLPMLLGRKKINAIVLLYYLIATVTAFVPAVFLSFAKPLFLGLVSIAGIAFLYSAGLAFKNSFKRAQTASKVAMLIALVGFLFGAA